MIEGGSATNILALDALVTWEYRALPDRNADAIVARVRSLAESEILPKYRRRAPQARLETTLHASYPGLVMDEASPAVRTALEITGANRAEAVAYGTEAGHFQRAGIPAVICGPGSIDQAHKADEFVALSELVACEAFLEKVIAKATA
jgi:acetylornithine deacetylase